MVLGIAGQPPSRRWILPSCRRVFLGVLGGVWFAFCYHPSVQSTEERTGKMVQVPKKKLKGKGTKAGRFQDAIWHPQISASC